MSRWFPLTGFPFRGDVLYTLSQQRPFPPGAAHCYCRIASLALPTRAPDSGLWLSSYA